MFLLYVFNKCLLARVCIHNYSQKKINESNSYNPSYNPFALRMLGKVDNTRIVIMYEGDRIVFVMRTYETD